MTSVCSRFYSIRTFRPKRYHSPCTIKSFQTNSKLDNAAHKLHLRLSSRLHHFRLVAARTARPGHRSHVRHIHKRRMFAFNLFKSLNSLAYPLLVLQYIYSLYMGMVLPAGPSLRPHCVAHTETRLIRRTV